MEIPAGERLTLVLTSRLPPAIGQGALVGAQADSCRIRVDPGSPDLEPGDTIVLDFVNTSHPLIRGRVETIDGNEVEVVIKHLQPRDQREFPRVESGLEVRYRLVPDDVPVRVLHEWVDSGAAPPDTHAWRTPEPNMDLSASGLAFDDDLQPEQGDRMMISFARPGQETPWRGIAQVVRVHPAGGGLRRIAVEFVRLPEGARQALMELTLELLRLPGETEDPEETPDP